MAGTRTHRGLALIEFLVALAIILILIATVAPWFSNPNKQAPKEQQATLTLEEERAAIKARIAELEAELATLRAQEIRPPPRVS